jgi:hypothetical protein
LKHRQTPQVGMISIWGAPRARAWAPGEHLNEPGTEPQPDAGSHRYLCIVPESVKERDPGLFLTFEGDHTLSFIISKAFLLAADSTIRDPGITGQIRELPGAGPGQGQV